MRVRPIRESDRAEWLELRRALWPTESREELERELGGLLESRERWGLFIAESEGRAVGFIECSLRDGAPGCLLGYVTTENGEEKEWD